MAVKPTYPGVYIQEIDSGSRVVKGVPTSITAFVGRAERGPANQPITCFNFGDFDTMFGGLTIGMPMTYAVQDFFENGGSQAIIVRVCAGPAAPGGQKGSDGERLDNGIVIGSESLRTGIYALDNADIFNIMVIPPDPTLGGDADMIVIYQAAATYCAGKRAILIADPLDAWAAKANLRQFDQIQPTDFNIDAIVDRRSVFTYFPRVKKQDPLRDNAEMVFSASGMIAGVFAASDVRRGVWKAPAGVEAGMNGVTALEYTLNDTENAQLNEAGINVLRDFPVIGKVIWGSRTLAGADALSDDYKYLPVRRLTDYIEESLLRCTKFAVFEPNAEPLWAQIRLSIGTFMADLARQGAFYDYYVRCDASTTTANDINLGKCNAIIGLAPVKPGEFIILTIQQLALKPAA